MRIDICIDHMLRTYMQTSHAYVVRTHAQAHVRTQHSPCNPPPPPPRSQANGGCTLRAFRRRRPPRSQADGGCTLRAFRRRRPLVPRRMGLLSLPDGGRMRHPTRQAKQNSSTCGSSRCDASTRRAQLLGMPDQVKLRTPKDKIWIPKTDSKNVGFVNMLFESCGGSATCVLHCMAMQSQAKQSKAKQSQAKQSQAKQSQAKQSTAKQASK